LIWIADSQLRALLFDNLPSYDVEKVFEAYREWTLLLVVTNGYQRLGMRTMEAPKRKLGTPLTESL
jgi:hypothetical protein